MRGVVLKEHDFDSHQLGPMGATLEGEGELGELGESQGSLPTKIGAEKGEKENQASHVAVSYNPQETPTTTR